MTLTQALRLLALLVDTVDAQQERIAELEQALREARDG